METGSGEGCMAGALAGSDDALALLRGAAGVVTAAVGSPRCCW